MRKSLAIKGGFLRETVATTPLWTGWKTISGYESGYKSLSAQALSSTGTASRPQFLFNVRRMAGQVPTPPVNLTREFFRHRLKNHGLGCYREVSSREMKVLAATQAVDVAIYGFSQDFTLFKRNMSVIGCIGDD